MSGFSCPGPVRENMISPRMENLSLGETNRSEVIQLIPVSLKKRRQKRSPNDIGWKRPPMVRGSLKTVINRSYGLDLTKSCFDGEKLYVRSWKAKPPTEFACEFTMEKTF